MLIFSSAMMVVICPTMFGMFMFATVRRFRWDLSITQSGKFTEWRMLPVSRKVLTWLAAMTAQLSSDSGVEAPRCGMAMTLLSFSRSSSGKSVT